MFKGFFKGLCDLIYPHSCLICQKHFDSGTQGEGLCLSCQSTIEVNRPPFCLKCSRHLTRINDPCLCGDCLKAKHHFDHAWAATLYNDTMQKLIHLFKYQSKTSLRKVFSRLMHAFIESYPLDMKQFDLLVPIPLHAARFRERGYNQSQLLCENIGKEFNIRQSYGNLLRKRATRNQALLGKKERWTNIQGAFTINNPSPFCDKSVLIVDDLFTTGTTVSEAARVLKESGAKNVDALTLAIAF